VKRIAHAVIYKVPRETCGFALVGLLLLHPCDEDDLRDDDAPQNTPDSKDAFECIDLHPLEKSFVTLCGMGEARDLHIEV
jgi:hypothetical protein